MDLIEKIKADIEQKREEITKLEIALEVCQRLAGKAKKPEEASEKSEASERPPLFTVRKRSTPASAKTTAAKKPGMTTAKPVLLKILDSHGPMKVGELVRISGFDTKLISNCMYSLKSAGKVKKEGGYWTTGQRPPIENPPVVDDDPTAIGEPIQVEDKDHAAA